MNNQQRCANDKMVNGQVALRHFIRRVCQRKEMQLCYKRYRQEIA